MQFTVLSIVFFYIVFYVSYCAPFLLACYVFFLSISTVSSYPVTYTIVYWYDVNVWHDLIFRFGLWCMHGSVCLCVFASDIYVDTSQGKKRVCSIQFFLFGLKIAWEKKQKQHTLLWGAHARIHKIIALSLMLFQFVLCYFFILDLFHSFFSSW